MRKKILVTGGAGFIGSHLCERLVSEGHLVFCLDNFYSGSEENIQHLLGEKSFILIRRDVRDEFLGLHVDEIYNMACMASPIYYQKNPIETTMTCVLGARNVLELARKCGAKVLQASTSEVYGDPLVHPQTEDYRGNVNPIGIRSCYDEGKRCAESLFFDYHRQYGVKIKVVRIFNCYGPRMAVGDGRVVPNLIMQALKGQPMTVFGDGSQTRSFQYVSDLIEGLLKMMSSDETFTGPVNIGNPQEFTIMDFAKKVREMTCCKSDIELSPLPSDDPLRRKPDITLAKEKLGWEPVVALDEGLSKTIEYFKNKSL